MDRQTSLTTATGESQFNKKNERPEKETANDEIKGKDDYEIIEGTFKHATPKEEVLPLAKILGGIDLDPCACDDSQLARNNIRNVGGLLEDWGKYDVVFANHPYKKGEAGKWHKKAYESDAEVAILLSRGSISSNWFHNHVINKADLICIPDERIKFVGYDNQPFFPAIYSVYGEYPSELREHFENKGAVIANQEKMKSSTAGNNEIIVQNKTNEQEPLFTEKISMLDSVTIFLNDQTKVKGKYRSKLQAQPLTGRIVDDPHPMYGHKVNGNAKYFELTATVQHEDGKETWIALCQNYENPNKFHCYMNDSKHWKEISVDRVKTNEDYESTKPSLGMISC